MRPVTFTDKIPPCPVARRCRQENHSARKDRRSTDFCSNSLIFQNLPGRRFISAVPGSFGSGSCPAWRQRHAFRPAPLCGHSAIAPGVAAPESKHGRFFVSWVSWSGFLYAARSAVEGSTAGSLATGFIWFNSADKSLCAPASAFLAACSTTAGSIAPGRRQAARSWPGCCLEHGAENLCNVLNDSENSKRF